MKKRILSIVLAICMVFTLMPHFVFAEGSTSATPSVSAYATKAQLMDDTFSPDLNGKATNIGKLAFGKKDGGAVQDWYILGGGDGEEYTILFAASPMTSWLPFANQSQDLDYKAEWECTYLSPVTTVHSNHYGGSNLRFELRDRLSNFTATEVNMINDTDLSIRDMKNTKNGGYYTITDKLYAVSCLDDKLMAGGVSDTIKFLARDPYWKTGYAFWLRTPCTESGCTDKYAYSVNPESGTFATHFTILEFSTARPAANLNLSSALFASAAQAASSDTATGGTIGKDSNGEPQAMTLRLDGSSKNIGTVTYNTTKGDIKATKGSTTGNVALVVQGNDGTNDWYYSKKITGTETVNVSAVKSALGLSSDIDLSACKVWLETTEDNVAYAVTVTGCSTEAELKAAIDAGEPAITLTANISLSSTLTLSDKIFTLDLAGRTITGNITLSDSSAEPQTIMTLIDSDPATGGVVKGNITLTRGNGSVSHLYANGGTITGMTSIPSYAGGIYCTSGTPTAFKGYVGNYGEIHGGMFYSGINESCIKEKTVTFMNNGSRYALQVLPSGNKATVPIALKKDGYTFLGWYNGDTKYDFTQAVTENITLTAKWVLRNISTEDELRSSIDGGATSIKLVSDIKLSSALDLSKKNITIDLNGYVISGANISINTGNGKASLTLKDSRSTATHSDSTLPKGGVVTSKIAMNQSGGGYNDCVLYANGGTVTSEFATNTNAVAIKCTSNTPTAFTGKISGYAHLYGGIYYGTIDSTVKVERKKITFQIVGNTYAYEVVDSASGYKTVAPISPGATKYGYQTFDGWYNGSTKYTFGSALNENITLTAKFSNLISYNITYNLNGGTATNPTSYTVESDAITLTNPTKNGYNFTGWSGTGLAGEANMTVTVPKGSMGNRVYTAHYQDITAPTGEISIGTNKWTEFFNNVTFGLFFKDTQNVTVTASDNSGEDVTIEYLLSNKELSSEELNTASFTAYSEAFSISPDNKYVVYVKLTDTSGNVTYINSNGIVLDGTAPTGEISIGTNKWTEFFNNVTFGLFFKETQNVTVTASDNSGEDVTIEYLLNDKELSSEELNTASFTAYNEAFGISPDNEYVIYAKLTDTSGNVTYINSNGIVLDGTAPVISGIENELTYCSPQTVTVTDEYIESVTVNGVNVALDENNQFILTAADGVQTVVATDKAGNTAEITASVSDAHTYVWQSAEGQYWQKCGVCGYETEKKDIPVITVEGADIVCLTQDYEFGFILPDGVYGVEYDYVFGSVKGGGLPVTTENGKMYGSIPSKYYAKDESGFDLVIYAYTSDGFLFVTRKSISLLSEHNYTYSNTLAEHPHTITHVCGVCGAQKKEKGTSDTCTACIFDLTKLSDGTYEVSAYNKTEGSVNIPSEFNGTPITKIGEACFKDNTAIEEVVIPDGVTSIGSLAFMNCRYLFLKVTIPASVTSIGSYAFYGFEGTIYCTKGSYAHEFALANNIRYILTDGVESENLIYAQDGTTVNSNMKTIYTTVGGCNDIKKIIGVSDYAEIVINASYSYGDTEYYGTGTVITVFEKGKYDSDYTLIVAGDVNGDSVCDVLDASQVASAFTGLTTLSGVYKTAADINSNDKIDAGDYQSIVNRALQ